MKVITTEMVERYPFVQKIFIEYLSKLGYINGEFFDYINLYNSSLDSVQRFKLSFDGSISLSVACIRCFSFVYTNYQEIKRHSYTVLKSDVDFDIVEYGKGIINITTERSEKISFIENYKLGKVKKFNQSFPLSYEYEQRDNNFLEFPIYEYMGKQYVCFVYNPNEDDKHSFSPDLDMYKSLDQLEYTYFLELGPLQWTVDKKSGLAVTNNPIGLGDFSFFTVKEVRNYEEKINSPEFLESFGVKNSPDVKNSTGSLNPFKKNEAPTELKDIVLHTLKGGKRIPYLIGHPGVGKTAIAKSLCESQYLCSINVSSFTPDDFSGKTGIIPEKIDYKLFGGNSSHEKAKTTKFEPEWHEQLEIISKNAEKENKRGLLFIDEFDKLTPNMQVFINSIVESPRKIAGWIIPDNIDIVLAGNTPEYSDAAFDISGEVASRLTKFNVEPDLDSWLKWAANNNVDPVVRSFLVSHREYFIYDVMDNSEYDYYKSLTPRSWDQKISEEMKAARAAGIMPLLDLYMDDKVKKEFLDYIRDYYEVLQIGGILEGNHSLEFFSFSNLDYISYCDVLAVAVSNEEELRNALSFLMNSNSEIVEAFKNRYLKIHDSRKDIVKFRVILDELSERSVPSGRKAF